MKNDIFKFFFTNCHIFSCNFININARFHKFCRQVLLLMPNKTCKIYVHELSSFAFVPEIISKPYWHLRMKQRTESGKTLIEQLNMIWFWRSCKYTMKCYWINLNIKLYMISAIWIKYASKIYMMSLHITDSK